MVLTFPRLTKVDSHLIVHVDFGNCKNFLHINADFDNDGLPFVKVIIVTRATLLTLPEVRPQPNVIIVRRQNAIQLRRHLKCRYCTVTWDRSRSIKRFDIQNCNAKKFHCVVVLFTILNMRPYILQPGIEPLTLVLISKLIK